MSIQSKFVQQRREESRTAALFTGERKEDERQSYGSNPEKHRRTEPWERHDAAAWKWKHESNSE